MTRNQVVKNVLFKPTKIKNIIPLPIMVCGHNLGFDLARLPDYDPGFAQGRDMFGGFSLIMGTNDGKPIPTGQASEAPKPSGFLPRVIMKRIGIGKRRYKCVSPFNGGLQTHIFIDIVQLTKALLGADTPASMDALCEMWKGPVPKEEVEHFKPLTPIYADYCYNDVQYGLCHKLSPFGCRDLPSVALPPAISFTCNPFTHELSKVAVLLT